MDTGPNTAQPVSLVGDPAQAIMLMGAIAGRALLVTPAGYGDWPSGPKSTRNRPQVRARRAQAVPGGPAGWEDMMGQLVSHYLVFETASGFCGIAWNELGITRFQLPARDAAATERLLLRRLPTARPGSPPPAVATAIAAVQRYFAGERTDFSGVELDLDGQGTFFKRIYAAARQVGWGRTTTYGTLAKELGAGPEAARDVGQAMASNPIPLLIPCHRVLAAGGKLGGFSAPGGAAAKLRMLELEGFRVEPAQPAQGSLDI